MPFSPASLPREARGRYEDKVNGKLLTTRIHRPHRTPDAHDNMSYWSGGQLDMTIFADGTVLFHVPIDEKVVLKNPVPCRKDTHAGIHRWHDTFSKHLRNLGVHVHPFWLFRKNHGGDWGFSIGDTMMDDLPTNMRMTCLHSNVLIFQILSRSTVFPPDSTLHDLVAQCYGDGYKALKTIIFKSHPACHDQPSTLCTTCPKQRDLTLLEHKMTFKDFLQVRSVVQGYSRTLDDESELDMFLNNTQHADHINRVTRDEQRVVACRPKHQGAQLLETIECHMMATDSPAKAKAINGSCLMNRPSSGRSNSRFRPPSSTPVRGARVNSLGTSPAPSSGSGTVTAEPLVVEGGADPKDGPFDSCEEVFADLAMNVEIPVDGRRWNGKLTALRHAPDEC